MFPSSSSDISHIPSVGFLPQRHLVLFLRALPELPQAQRGKNGGQYILISPGMVALVIL